MKLDNLKNKKSRLTTFVLVFSMLLSATSITSFADSKITNTSEFTDSENITSDYEGNEANYSEDKVIIQLADTQQNEDLQFYSVYSDEYTSINSNVSEMYTANDSECVKIAESTDVIKSELDLGIEFSEMKLLNPSAKKSRNGLYSIDRDNNDCNNIFSLTLKDMTVGEALEILNDNPAIEVAEPNYLYEFCNTPNDPDYSEQYALNNIKAPLAWNYTTGSSDVVVGIIDSGIDGTHPDLVDNIWDNPYYHDGLGCSRCSRSYDYHGYNFTGEGSSNGKPCGGTPNDIFGHGTHVAGIVGAKGNNGIGISGVNWNVKLAWLGILSDKRFMSSEAAIEALNYANNHNITIVNNSYGGSVYSSIFEKAISDYNGLFVAAAGNDSSNNNINHIYPSDYNCPNIISVANTNNSNDLSLKSNYGTNTVHVAAPGSNIYSTIPGGEYEILSGTSMSAPCVAGIAALIKAKNPSYNAQQIKAAICGTVQRLGKTYNIIYDGGIVNAYSAVNTPSSSLKSITFNYNYSGSPSSFVDYVVSGKKVYKPVDYPVRTGYIFKGWYTTSSGNTQFNFNNSITSNTTIYAQWTPVLADSYGEKFPDHRFRDKVISILNEKDGGLRTINSIVTESDIHLMKSITSLNVSSLRIKDMTGIDYFSNLKVLECNNNDISYMDLSNLTSIYYINCYNNRLTDLDMNLESLEILYCSNNLLSNLNLKSATSLHTLNCQNNQLTSLSVTSLPKLRIINCSYNKIKILSIMSCPVLTKLICSHNKISDLNTFRLGTLQYLDCSYNNLSTLTTGGELTELHCNNNMLTKLNISESSKLENLYCHDNFLYVINTLNSPKLYNVNVSNNNLSDHNDIVGYNRWSIPIDFCTHIFNPQKKWIHNPFSDIPENEYYYKAIEYVYNKGYITGTFPTRFEPTYTLSRGQLATIIYRMAGSPSVSGLSNPFTDVSSSSSYLNAIKWVYNNGNKTIMGGTSSTIFEPNTMVSREMVAVVLDRYATRKNISFTKLRGYSAFTDDSQISSWAKSSVTKLYEAGIINGADSKYFYPTEQIIRGDVAMIVRKFEVIRLYL